MKLNRFLSAAICLALTLWGASCPAATEAEFGTMKPVASNCSPDSDFASICQDAPEDLVRVPGTDLLVSSALRGKGGIYLVDTHAKTTTMLWHPAGGKVRFDAQAYRACPGPVTGNDRVNFLTHGLSLRYNPRGASTLYAVHHGGREAIEVFSLVVRRGVPELTWTGCIVAPPRIALNSVVATDDGGVIATNFDTDGPIDVPLYLKMGREEITGEAWRWNRRRGWSVVPGTAAPAPNGVVLSQDGKALFMAAWLQGKVWRIPLKAGAAARTSLDLGFRVDNLRWGDDGMLYASGQGFDDSSHVVRIDPATMAVSRLIAMRTTEHFGQATVGIPVGDAIWVGFIGSARIGVFPRSALPKLEVEPIFR